MKLKRFFIGVFLSFSLLTNSLAEDNVLACRECVDIYEEFKEEIALPFQSLKLISNIGHENLSFNLWAGMRTYPEYLNKYIKNIPNDIPLTNDYLIRSVLLDNSISKSVRKEKLRDFIRNEQSYFVNSMKSESNIITETLRRAFEDDLKGAINEIKLNKNNRIDAKWKKSLIGKIDEIKGKVGKSSTANVDELFDSISWDDFNSKINVDDIRFKINTRSSYIDGFIGEFAEDFKFLNAELERLHIPKGLEIAGAAFDVLDVYSTWVKFIDNEVTAKDYFSSLNSVGSLLALSKFFQYSKTLGWLQVIEGTRQITENNVKLLSLLNDQQHFSDAIKDIENKYLNPLQMQQYYTYYVNKIITDIKIDTIYAQQAIIDQDFDLMMAHLDGIERTQEFARELKENDSKGYLDKGAIFVGLLGLNVDVKLLNEFEDIINAPHDDLVVNFSKSFMITSFNGLDEASKLNEEIDSFLEGELNNLLERSAKITDAGFGVSSLLLTLPSGSALKDSNTISSPINSTISFEASLTSSSFRACISAAGEQSSIFSLWYLDVSDGGKRKSLNLSYDRLNQIFSFTMPNSEIVITDISYDMNAGSESDIGSCDVPSVFEEKEDIIKPIVYAGNLKKTHQNISYQKHDDGYYQIGKDNNYTKSEGSNIITDNVTGLSWLDKEKPPVTHSQAISYCSNMNHESFDDWRLPSIHELLSITHEGREPSAIDDIFTSMNVNISSWSSTGHSSNTSSNAGSWGLHFNSGRMNYYYSKYNPGKYSALCVRGTPLEYDSYSRQNNIVTSLDTGLSWQDDWQVKSKTFNWSEALNFCNYLSLSGFSDWRLPNQKELMTISDFKNFEPALNSIFRYYNGREYHWSSTTFQEDSNSAWDSFGMTGMASFHYRPADLKNSKYKVRCVRGGIESVEFSQSQLNLISENYIDKTIVKTSFIKKWVFNKDLTDLTIDILENGYQNSLTENDLIKEGKVLKVNLTPDIIKNINKLTLQFKDSYGKKVKVSGSETFWSLTKTNHAPRLADGQITSLIGNGSSYLDIETYDSDGDSVTLSVEDDAGGIVTLSGNRLNASFSDGQVAHVVKIGLSDGKEKIIKEFTSIDFSQNAIEDFYSDVDTNSEHFDAIAFGTLKGVIGGQVDPNDGQKRIFRPNDNVSLAEALKMVINAEREAGLIELTTADEYIKAYPAWAMKYYTFAREKGALDKEVFNLSEIYPTREMIAKLVVKTLGLDSKFEGISLPEVNFTDASAFTDTQMSYFGEVVHRAGLFMLGESAEPKELVTRGELATVILKIFMIPHASLLLTPQSVEQGAEDITPALSEIKAKNIDSNYQLQDSQSSITMELFTGASNLSNPISSDQLTTGENIVYAILDNGGVKNTAFASVVVTFLDNDNDGVQDSKDPWAGDARYGYDDNQNGIPDILDLIYGLEDHNGSDTVSVEGGGVLISDVILSGGIIINEDVPDLTGTGRGDGDGDGVRDISQPDVSSIKSITNGEWLTVRNDKQAQQSNLTTKLSPLTAPDDQHLALGVTQLDIATDVGEDITIEMFIDKAQQISDYLLLGNDGNWHEMNASIEELGDKKKVSFVVKEGGNFDQDQASNGVLKLVEGGVMVKTGLEILPSSFLFGKTEQGASSPVKSFIVKNTGLRTLSINDAYFIGQHASDYAINNNLCRGASLEANEECSIEVSFTPSTSGSKAAALNIVTDDPDNANMLAFLKNYESPKDESARRLPPVLNSLAIYDETGVEVNSMKPNTDYTIEWSILGYHKNYISSVVMFDCTGIADETTCGANYSDNERFLSSGAVNASSTEQSGWNHNGEYAKNLIFRHAFTTPDYQSSTPVVIRFYRLNTSDLNSGGGGLSLIIPGNHTEAYYDTTGRRVKNVIAP